MLLVVAVLIYYFVFDGLLGKIKNYFKTSVDDFFDPKSRTRGEDWYKDTALVLQMRLDYFTMFGFDFPSWETSEVEKIFALLDNTELLKVNGYFGLYSGKDWWNGSRNLLGWMEHQLPDHRNTKRLKDLL